MTATDVPGTDQPADPARRHARRTRAAQGLPATVTAAEALDRLADLIGDDGADTRYAPSMGAQGPAR